MLGGSAATEIRCAAVSIVSKAWLLPVAIALFLSLCPFLVRATVTSVRANNVATERAEASWRPVQAVLLESVPGRTQAYYGSMLYLTPTPARWTADGVQRTGKVSVPRGSQAGSTVTVWVDPSGALRSEPLTKSQASGRVFGAAFGASLSLAASLAVLVLVARLLLYRRKMKSWESGWQMVGPTWTRQH